MVVVGCKLPQGLIITVGRKGTPQDKGTRDAQVILTDEGKRLRLFGTHAPNAQCGFGFTENVDGDTFAAWLKEHAEWAPVKAGLVWAEPTMAEAIAHARDFELVANGFEPLGFDDPMKDGTIKPDEKSPKPDK